jgi:hypothetical protein
MTQEQFDRLPKFARDELVKLRRDLDRAREQVADREDKLASSLCDEPTRIEVQHYNGSRMAFLKDDAMIRIRFTDLRDDWLDIRGNGADGIEIRGGTTLVIRPIVGNVVQVDVRDRESGG